MVEGTIRSLDRNVAFRGVHAARGKITRAEPISALYEQRRVHHVGTFQALEDQMCSFTSDFDRKPSRQDEGMRIIEEYAADLREIIVKLRKHCNFT